MPEIKAYECQTNSANVDEVCAFFHDLGMQALTTALLESPASGVGSLVKVTVHGFDPFNLRGEVRDRWLAISDKLESCSL